jgi:hypothetical protein
MAIWWMSPEEYFAEMSDLRWGIKRTRDEFSEAKHPRSANGEFGSGGGSAEKGKSGEPVRVNTTPKTHPFVGSFLKEYTTERAQREHLKDVPKEKLKVALKLIANSGDEWAGSLHVKKMIEKELDERSDRGA